MHRRRKLAVASLVFVLLAACSVGVASAGPSVPKPKAGSWKFTDASGGFSLIPGRGAKRGSLSLANVHSLTQNFVGCPTKSQRITVSGRFRLKVITLPGGYKVLGVGRKGTEKRYSDGDTGLVSIPAAVKVDGKRVAGGGLKMDFYEGKFVTLIIEFGPKNAAPCITYSQSASHR